MLEKEIEKKVCAYARSKGCLTYKFVSPTQRGVPDRIIIYRGEAMFIEFKQRGKTPTKLQEHKIAELRTHDMRVLVVDNLEYGMAVIDDLVNPVTVEDESVY